MLLTIVLLGFFLRIGRENFNLHKRSVITTALDIALRVIVRYNYIKVGTIIMKFIKALSKLTALTLSLSILTILLAGCTEPKNEMRNMSTMEIVKDMGLGINLGNTF